MIRWLRLFLRSGKEFSRVPWKSATQFRVSREKNFLKLFCPHKRASKFKVSERTFSVHPIIRNSNGITLPALRKLLTERKIEWTRKFVGGERNPFPTTECQRRYSPIYDTKYCLPMPPCFTDGCLTAQVCPAEMRRRFPMKAGTSSSTTPWMKSVPPLAVVTTRQHGCPWNWKSKAEHGKRVSPIVP